MNDRSLASLVAEMDSELARRNDISRAIDGILSRVEERAPGAVLRCAARTQLRSLGCAIATR